MTNHLLQKIEGLKAQRIEPLRRRYLSPLDEGKTAMVLREAQLEGDTARTSVAAA